MTCYQCVNEHLSWCMTVKFYAGSKVMMHENGEASKIRLSGAGEAAVRLKSAQKH